MKKKAKMEDGRRKMGMRRAHRPPFSLSPLSLLVAAIIAVGCIASAQKLANVVVHEFGPVRLDYQDPPFESIPRTILSGAEAEPLSSSHLIEIRKIQLQMLNTNGDVEMTITAPQCVLDLEKHEVNSSGKVEIRTADGKLLNSGEGFLWQQTNSVLYISNSMSTRIRGASTNSLFK